MLLFTVNMENSVFLFYFVTVLRMTDVIVLIFISFFKQTQLSIITTNYLRNNYFVMNVFDNLSVTAINVKKRRIMHVSSY